MPLFPTVVTKPDHIRRQGWYADWMYANGITCAVLGNGCEVSVYGLELEAMLQSSGAMGQPPKRKTAAMSYHKACYEQATGRTTTRVAISSKNNPSTGKPYVCQACGKDITHGQEFTWIPNGQGPKRQFQRSAQHHEAPKATFGDAIKAKLEEASKAKASEQEQGEAQGQEQSQEEAEDSGDGSPSSDDSSMFNLKSMANKMVKHLRPHWVKDDQALIMAIKDELPQLTKDVAKELEDFLKDANAGQSKEPEVFRIQVDLTTNEGKETKDFGIQHKLFPVLLQMLSARDESGKRVNVWIAGVAGSGKTTAGIKAAEALGVNFYYTGAVNDAFLLMGYNDATGRYVETPFYQAYKNGGLFLWDEVDACDPNAVLAFQAAIENGQCAFPCGIVKKHPDFICMAAANTWGLGATADYVGRNRLDAAFLDRFVMLDWDLDEGLEKATAQYPEWCKYVQTIRAKVKERGLRVLVTPRATYQGCMLLSNGLPIDSVIRSTIRKTMTPEQWEQVKLPTTPKIEVKKPEQNTEVVTDTGEVVQAKVV